MKFTTRDAIYLFDTIGKISEMGGIENAPIEVKFLLVRNSRAIEPIWIDFMEARRDLMMKNSEPISENSEERKASQEQLEYINSEIIKLEKVEVEIPVTPIPLSKLESLNLGIAEMNGLYPIIENEEA